MSITEQFKQKKKDKYVDAHTLYKKIKTLFKNSEMYYADINKKNLNPPEMESSTCTHAAGQYALFKYLHSFSFIYMFI